MRGKIVCQALVFLVLGFLEFITVELFLDRFIIDLGVEWMFKNVLLYWVGNLILVSLFHRTRPAMMLSSVFVLVVGIANYLITMFRGYGIVFLDFYAVRTAVTVAGRYSIEWKPCFVAGMAVGLLVVFLSTLLPGKQGSYFQKKTVGLSLLGLGVSALFGVWINTSASFFHGVSELAWDHRIGIHDYGYALYFMANAGTGKPDKPSGYSPERAEEILARYRVDVSKETDSLGQVRSDSGTDSAWSVAGDTHPNIILIMNESFADLRVLGEGFHSNQDVMPFFDSLTENTIKGYAEASVYGGYTSNSEFEFLTGCTKVFLPGNPYLQYLTAELPSLISTVKVQKEYREAVAIHPYYPSGYNRNRVYPLLDFDRFLSLEDFSDPELLRDYVSDEETYRQIYKLYEKKPTGSRLCLFTVTMQNHNPYRSDWVSEEPVRFSKELRDAPVNQYLSLIRKSDDALRDLIQYFERQTEPVLIVFFGDHQPHLSDTFYGKVMDKLPVQFSQKDVLKKHLVPYLLWANYDIPEQDREQVSSLNYLSPLVLRTAGLPMTDYHRFLLDVEQAVPSISASGYYDAQGQAGEIGRADAMTEKWLNEYEIVQYYYLFDRKHRSDEYFTID